MIKYKYSQKLGIFSKLKRIEGKKGKGGAGKIKSYKIINHDEAAATASVSTVNSTPISRTCRNHMWKV